MTAAVLEMKAGDPYKDQQARVGLGKSPTIVLWPDTEDERGLSIYRLDKEGFDPALKCFMIVTDDVDGDPEDEDDQDFDDDQVLGVVHLPHCPTSMWADGELWRRRVGMDGELPGEKDMCLFESMPWTTVSEFRGRNLDSDSDEILIVSSEDGQHRVGGWV